ncbi:ribonuclease P protein subunit [Candidatus Thorarchaeota archaeon]|jgi:ribonuclease P protein subunit POP4|nr:ribonuclease P protein subunit [Candidatus Thorarchaeota archaeon]TFG94589.1 MAG: ribonuclease P protein subunit [Candidatus Thorarchaeota archaeon]
MRIAPENIVRHELTGLATHVVESKDPTLVCRSGVILGETREMLRLNTKNGEVCVSKSVCVFDITLPNGAVVRVDGNVLRGRPEDRMKKRLNRSW